MRLPPIPILEQLAAGCYGPGGFDAARAMAVDLFVKVHHNANVVHEDLQFVAHAELAITLRDIDEAVLLAHLVEVSARGIEDFAEADAGCADQLIGRESLRTAVDQHLTALSDGYDRHDHRRGALVEGTGIAANRIAVVEDVGSRTNLVHALDAMGMVHRGR